MTEEEFYLLRGLAAKEFGIMLADGKRLTLHAKISHRLRILGLPTYRSYYEFIRADDTKDELFTFASHITNKETYFFREKAQLEIFSGLLKDIKRRSQQKNRNIVTVMSLGCSSGEEAYSLNIILKGSGHFVLDWRTRVIGVDIDRNALRKAEEACYTQNSFRDTERDAGLIERCFKVEGGRYILLEPFTKDVEFRHGNALDPVIFEGLSDLDAIFWRNMMIYLSDEAIDRIIARIYNSLSDDGRLFIGSSESLIQRTDLFVPEYSGDAIVYRKKLK